MAKNVHSYNIIPLYDNGSETWPLWKTGSETPQKFGNAALQKDEEDQLDQKIKIKKVLHIVANKSIYIQGVAECTGNLSLVPNGEREITEQLK